MLTCDSNYVSTFYIASWHDVLSYVYPGIKLISIILITIYIPMDIFMYIEIIDVCMPLKLRKFTCTHTDIDKMYFKMKNQHF